MVVIVLGWSVLFKRFHFDPACCVSGDILRDVQGWIFCAECEDRYKTFVNLPLAARWISVSGNARHRLAHAAQVLPLSRRAWGCHGCVCKEDLAVYVCEIGWIVAAFRGA